MNIRTYKEVLTDTFKEIKKYQSGDRLIVKTNKEYLDEYGITSASVIVLAGASFTGKTMELEELKSAIMSVEINSKAANFVWLSNSLEMTNMATTLRALSAHLGVSKKEMLSKDFDITQQRLANEYFKSAADHRFYINEDQPTVEDFKEYCEDFLEQHRDKDLVVIDFDHSALVRGSNKKQTMDDLYEIVLELKKKYNNSLFIFVSQFNREVLGRIAEKSNEMASRRSDLYQSDSLFQVADVVVCLQVPHKLGIEQYRLVSPKFYSHLTEHFGDIDRKGKVSFKTYGRIFFEVLKNRFAEGFAFRDLFIKQIEDDSDYQAVTEESQKYVDLTIDFS